MDTNLFLLQSASTAALMAQQGQLRNTIIIGIIGLFSSAITTIGTILLARIGSNTKLTALAAQATAETVKNTDGKTAVLLTKTEEIHTLTNSNLTKVTAALETSQAEVKSLKEMISQMNLQMKETAFTLARLRQQIDTQGEDEAATLAIRAAVAESVVAPVKQAIQESVKAPVKEAVQETTFTQPQLDQIIRALEERKTP